MYLLYLDESGTHAGAPAFVLSGIAVLSLLRLALSTDELLSSHLRPKRRRAARYRALRGASIATERLFATEARLRDDPDHGVVLLYAEDEESLRKTHGSYFLGFDELLETARG